MNAALYIDPDDRPPPQTMLNSPPKLALVAFCLTFVLAFQPWRPSPFPDPNGQLQMLRSDGLKQSLDDFHGKSVLVSFWATSCVICMKEIEQFNALNNMLDPDHFAMVAVAMHHDRPDWVVEAINKRNIQYPVFFDLERKIARNFDNVVATPTSFLLNPDGEVVYHHMGHTDFDHIEKLVKEFS